MSYAIVRNEKLTRAEVNGKGTHNDRKAKNHTNKDIDPTRTHLNYYIKKNELTYTKEFDKYLKTVETEYLLWDGIHPTIVGHEIIAKQWYKCVKSGFDK